MAETRSEPLSPFLKLAVYYRDTASTHGVVQAGGEQLYKFRRCLWSMLVLAMASGLICLAYLHFDRYFMYPTVNIVTVRSNQSIPFPAVTICNLNQFHLNRIPNDPRLHHILYKMSDSFIIFEKEPPLSPQGSEANKRTVKIETGEELLNFARDAAHTSEEMFIYCMWRIENKSCSDIFNLTMTDHGVCYTFNAARGTPRLQSLDSGPIGGLVILMNIQQDFYYFSKNTQPGIKVLLHEPDETPLLMNHGFFVRPGTFTDIVIHRQQTSQLGKPYKSSEDAYCIDTRSADFRSPLTRFPNVSYTKSACWQDCYINRLVEICGCRHFFDPGDDEICSIDLLEDCYIPQAAKTKKEDIQKCDCRSPCFEVGYSNAISSTDIASKFIVQQMVNQNVVPHTDYVRDNLLELRVYYDSLLLTEVEQKSEMTVTDILGIMGGYMGLFLGASILSLVEILEVILLAWISYCLGRWTTYQCTPQLPSTLAERPKVSPSRQNECSHHDDNSNSKQLLQHTAV